MHAVSLICRKSVTPNEVSALQNVRLPFVDSQMTVGRVDDAMVTIAGVPPTTNSPRQPWFTQIPFWSNPQSLPRLQLCLLICLASCTPYDVFAAHACRRPSVDSQRNVCRVPSVPLLSVPTTNSPRQPLSTQNPLPLLRVPHDCPRMHGLLLS